MTGTIARLNSTVEEATAFVFPGQGSQYAGMARDLAWCDNTSLELIECASDVTGLPVRQWMTSGDTATIADPEIAQLVVFVHSAILLRELRCRGVHPVIVAGHSLGEYTALLAAGVLGEEAALRLVAARGRAMSAAAQLRPGAMGAVVGLDEPTLRALCTQASASVNVANLNSPRQAVVSGTAQGVEQVLAAAKGAGALRARRLPVGGAYHSPLMARAQDELAPSLLAAPFASPVLPLVSSVDGALVTDIEAHRRSLLVQITAPVQWHRAFLALRSAGVRHFVEVGPGRVLAGLGRETDKTAVHGSALDAVRTLAATSSRSPRS